MRAEVKPADRSTARPAPVGRRSLRRGTGDAACHFKVDAFSDPGSFYAGDLQKFRDKGRIVFLGARHLDVIDAVADDAVGHDLVPAWAIGEVKTSATFEATDLRGLPTMGYPTRSKNCSMARFTCSGWVTGPMWPRFSNSTNWTRGSAAASSRATPRADAVERFPTM